MIATSAVRDATNRGELLEGIRSLGFEVDSVSGEEEARLGVIAVANGFDLKDAWVMDLGGGSAQLSLMRDRLFRQGSAYPLGAMRLTEAFLHSDPPKAKEVRRLVEAVQDELGPTLAAMAEDSLPLVAMGGTIRNLARAVQKKSGYPIQMMHSYFLAREDFERLTDELLQRTAQKRAAVPGVSGDRADIILAGALVYRVVLEQTGRDGLWISGNGVREGAFFSRFLPEPHLVPDVRRFAVDNLAHHFLQPHRHLSHVRRLSRRLFDELEPLHGLDARAAELLEAAATLHDIGMTVGYHLHHKHGEYLVLSARLNGYDHREQALLSRLVRYHRKGMPKLGAISDLTDKGDAWLLAVLSFCLRLAEMMERSRSGRVDDVHLRIKSKMVRLDVLSSEEPVVELWEAGKQAQLFERIFERPLTTRWVETEA